MKLLDPEIGKSAVRFARCVVGTRFGFKDSGSLNYSKKHGVFVTIYRHPSLQLRGCIGFIGDAHPLNRAIAEAAMSAAFEDPRFMPLAKNEFNEVVFEVSILTEPELVKGDKIKQIQIGRDGVIVEADGLRGVLLPKVAVEQRWDAKDFLENACLKAGLLEDAWGNEECNAYKFQAQVFREREPEGDIIWEKA